MDPMGLLSNSVLKSCPKLNLSQNVSDTNGTMTIPISISPWLPDMHDLLQVPTSGSRRMYAPVLTYAGKLDHGPGAASWKGEGGGNPSLLLKDV